MFNPQMKKWRIKIDKNVQDKELCRYIGTEIPLAKIFNECSFSGCTYVLF